MTRIVTDWNNWSQPNDLEVRQMVEIMCRHVKFLNPEIVSMIVKENNGKLDEWRNEFTRLGINKDSYLWKDSSFCFPGIRRYRNQERKLNLRHKPTKILRENNIYDALMVDDNDYPKHVWSFTFTGKKFSKIGPKGYSLAHILSHNSVDRLLSGQEEAIYGLFTCISNTVYIPNSFIKPTDFDDRIRHILFKRACELYQGCAFLPDGVIMKSNHQFSNLGDFKFSNDFIGSIDKTKEFIKFRNDKINELINSI